ncbi:hypothetical protein NVP1285O_21 [Vibrio phage 1.285.O._10N.286.55.C12]|nr:hypothetical protein NVP1285O_21 [Vibrio phage 1.285.O._10N.286.55.C12]
MRKSVKRAYETLGFSEDKPATSGTYAVVCMEYDDVPYLANVCIDPGLVEDPELGTTDLESYHCGLTDLLYKRVSD